MTSPPDGTCLLCGSPRLAAVADRTRDSQHRVVRCRQCSLIQLSPVPTAAEQHLFHVADRQSRAIGIPRAASAIARRKAWDTRRRVAWIGRHVARGARVLDVGSGYGTLLTALQREAYPVVGLELSASRRRVSRRLNGVPVVAGDLQAPPPNLGRFDAVLLIHVLEHLSDPVSALRTIATLLAPGGRLFIEVPNADDLLLAGSPGYRAFYWQRAHASYFTAATLAAVLKRAGWRVTAQACVQRYGIENFAAWIGAGAPQLKEPSFETSGPYRWLEAHYKTQLEHDGRADTLTVVAAPMARARSTR